MNRKLWIDLVKAICMIGVYLCHSEAYCEVNGLTLGNAVRPFYVNAFFFVSGYLFFQKWLSNKVLKCQQREGYVRELRNLLFRLIIPTLLFSALNYIPKMLFHGSSINFFQFTFDVFGGISYWFTSALVVSQMTLLSLVFLTKQKNIWVYVIMSIFLFFTGWYLNGLRIGNNPSDFFPWFYQTGLEYTFVMALGGVYGQYEKRIDQIMIYGFIVVLFSYLLPLVDAWQNQRKLQLMGLGGNCDWEGFICLVCGIGIVIALCKKLKARKWLIYIGKNSIVFYFFSGVYPALMGTIAQWVLPEKNYIIILVVTLVSIVMGMATTYIINRYAPFMIDLRKLKHQ